MGPRLPLCGGSEEPVLPGLRPGARSAMLRPLSNRIGQPGRVEAADHASAQYQDFHRYLRAFACIT